MKKKVLIIGNGFDLYHGLPTGYKDFLFFAKNWNKFKEEYDKTENQGEHYGKEVIDVRLGEKNTLTEESLQDFGKHAYLYSPEHISFLNEHLRDNAWLTYFGKNAISGHNWIDFEKEIERALEKVEEYYHDFLPSIVSDVPMKHMPEFMSNVIFLFSEKAEKAGTGYVNLANRMFRIKDTDLEYIRPNKMCLLETMKNDLNALNKCLAYYFLDFISVIKCRSYSEQIQELGNVYLLNFNYTYTYAKIYGEQAILQYHPIHGEAKEDNLVFGIPDEAFPDTLDYVYFQKYFQRIQKRTGNFYKEWPVRPQYSTLGDEPVQVFIMGHSLSKVDRGVLKDFFFEKNVDLITIFYHSQSGYESQIINLVDMFGKDFVIDQTGRGRIVFEKLRSAVEGSLKLEE